MVFDEDNKHFYCVIIKPSLMNSSTVNMFFIFELEDRNNFVFWDYKS